jgi:hypothetical protein
MAHYDILIAKKYRAIHGDTANPNNTTTAAPPASDSFPPKRPTNKPSQSQQSSATPSAPDPATRPVHLTVPSYRRRPPSPQSNANSPVQIARDIKHLAQYFDIYGIAEHIRARADIFHDLKRSVSAPPPPSHGFGSHNCYFRKRPPHGPVRGAR